MTAETQTATAKSPGKPTETVAPASKTETGNAQIRKDAPENKSDAAKPESVQSAPKAETVKPQTVKADTPKPRKAQSGTAAPAKAKTKKVTAKSTVKSAARTPRKASTARPATKNTAPPKAATKAEKETVQMTKKAEALFEDNIKQMQDLLTEFKGGFADLPLANDEFGKLMTATRDATVSSMQDVNKEISNFTQTRMTECWETTREMMTAKSMPEALEVQSKYMQDAYKAYVDEVQKLNTIATSATQKALAPMSDGMFDMFSKMFTGRAA